MASILLVEDDVRVASFVSRGLSAEGHVVTVARDGASALELGRSGGFPLIILDRSLPELGGVEVCEAIRAAGVDCRILMLTARGTVEDRVSGLRSGADDYLVKPFAYDELLARIDALLRRDGPGSGPPGARLLRVGDLQLDPAAKRVARGGRAISLTAKEFALLEYLMQNAGDVVSRARILSHIWGLNFDPGTKVIDVYIRYLRAKVDDDADIKLIRTIRGFGYLIASDEAA